jgi:cytochrome b561
MSTSPSDAPAGRYTRIAILLHWVVAALVVAQVTWGWWMQEIPKQPVGPRVDAFNLHKSVGLTIFALMVVRLAWRLAHRPPPLPPIPAWQARLAHAVQALLYVALFAMPVAGYLGSVWSGYPVKLYGMTLLAWGAKDVALKDAMGAVHLGTSLVLVGLFALHVAGALKHALVDRDGLLARMGVGRPRADPADR